MWRAIHCCIACTVIITTTTLNEFKTPKNAAIIKSNKSNCSNRNKNQFVVRSLVDVAWNNIKTWSTRQGDFVQFPRLTTTKTERPKTFEMIRNLKKRIWNSEISSSSSCSTFMICTRDRLGVVSQIVRWVSIRNLSLAHSAFLALFSFHSSTFSSNIFTTDQLANRAKIWAEKWKNEWEREEMWNSKY